LCCKTLLLKSSELLLLSDCVAAIKALIRLRVTQHKCGILNSWWSINNNGLIRTIINKIIDFKGKNYSIGNILGVDCLLDRKLLVHFCVMTNSV